MNKNIHIFTFLISQKKEKRPILVEKAKRGKNETNKKHICHNNVMFRASL
jgi:hypothetical protein